jgi:hypothetical protein
VSQKQVVRDVKRELKLQTDIINSVRRDGGYSRKLSNRYQVGIPDLLISFPTFAPCLVEVKDFGPVNSDFDRAVGVTPKQALELSRIAASQTYPFAFIFVGFQMMRQHYLLYLPHSTKRVSSALLKGMSAPVIQRGKGQYYDIEEALMELGVPVIGASITAE